MSINSLTNYKETTINLAADMQTLETYCTELELNENASSLRDLSARINSDHFNVAVMGEFKRGKSSLLNALLNTPILPTDVLPATAAINRVTYGPDTLARVQYKDGRSEEIPVERLANYVTQLTEQSTERAAGIAEAIVYFPTNYCRNNVDLIDTPGLNASEADDLVSASVIPKVDAAVFVFDPAAPFSMSEEEFLREKLLTADVGRVLFVATKMDLYSPEDQKRLLSHIRDGLRSRLLEKAQIIYADHPDELSAFEQRLGDLKVLGVSAKQAMEARKTGDEELLQKSGFPAFEAELDQILLTERGRILLTQQSSRILSVSGDIFQTIQMRLSATMLDEDEFALRCKKIDKEIAAIQRRKEEEFERLDEGRRTLDAQMVASTQDYWCGARMAANDVVDAFPLEKEDLKTKETAADTQARLQEAIQSKCEQYTRHYAEKVQTNINLALGREIDGMKGFMDDVSDSLRRIENVFTTDKSLLSKGETTVVTLLNYMTAFAGSSYMGWKVAGWKGALLGGVTGFASAMISASAMGALVGALGLALTWPVMLIIGILTTAVSVLTGHNMVKSVFFTRRADQFRDDYKKALKGFFDELQAKNDIAPLISTQINEAYNALKTQVDKELTETLGDMQRGLLAIKENFAAAKAEQEQKAARYGAIIESTLEIGNRAREVREQLQGKRVYDEEDDRDERDDLSQDEQDEQDEPEAQSAAFCNEEDSCEVLPKL